MNAPENHRFVVLDALRGLAAVAVVFYHAGIVSNARWIVPRGYLAVDFFFVLSGFVLAYAYGARLEKRTFLPEAFVRVRLIRLWPLVALGVGLGAIVRFADPVAQTAMPTLTSLWVAIALAVGMFPNPFAPFFFPLNPPLWSVSAELGVNVAWGIFASRLRGWRLPALVAAAAGWIIIDFIAAGKTSDMSRVVYGFFAGVLVYRFPRGRHSATRVACLLAALVILTLMFTRRGVSDSALEALGRLALFPAVVWLGAGVELQGTMRRVSLFSGELSYPLYALHGPVVILMVRHGWPASEALAVSVAFAFASARLYDRRVRGILGALGGSASSAPSGGLSVAR